jgi:thiosulfate/3-mercaptopyruvate sulfurtransferase
VAPLEPWERVWIDADVYSQDLHSQINCTVCHQGEAVDDMETAHTGMVESPAAPEYVDATCGSCHPNITPASKNSLHTTLRGYDTVLYERSDESNLELIHSIEEMEEKHCNECHATCGDCHVSQPKSVGGGLIESHVFREEPSMSQNCTACHGSRVKNEYYGSNEGVPSDVHFRARMSCTDCHNGMEMHGLNPDGTMMMADHRYDGPRQPSCESCHQEQAGIGSGIEMHEIHGTEILACQVCHSTTYTNCINCHVEQSDEGIPFYTVEEHSLGFFIGQNVLQSAERPYRYVPVRHVPIDVDSFSYYGEDLLPNFHEVPTWAYATPHNIQRNTPQTESCLSCHENNDVFLTQDKVVEFEWPANVDVMVDEAPELPEGYLVEEAVEEDDVEDAAPTDEDEGFWTTDGDADEAPSDETEDADESFWGDDSGADTEDDGDDDDAFWNNDDSNEDDTSEEDDESSSSDGSGDDESFWN